MYVFIWKPMPDRHYNGEVDIHSDTIAAWASFSRMTVDEFPNVIIQINEDDEIRKIEVVDFFTNHRPKEE